MQRWRGLASQARAEGQSLQAKRDEEAALYADQVYMHTCGAHALSQRHAHAHPPKCSCWLNRLGNTWAMDRDAVFTRLHIIGVILQQDV